MPPFKPTSGLSSSGLRRLRGATGNVIAEADTGESGLTREGLRRAAGKEEPEVQAAPLSTQQRKSLPKSSFVFPDKAPGPGSYPIQDRAHAANALSRSEGKPEEATVRRTVCSRYPDLPECKEND